MGCQVTVTGERSPHGFPIGLPVRVWYPGQFPPVAGIVVASGHFGIPGGQVGGDPRTRAALREITSSDVDTVLEPLRGHRRYNAIMALRSLFRFAKRRGLTFAGPTRHLSGGRGTGRTVLPMTAEEIRSAGQAAVTPAQRLAIALAAVHAARPKAIRELILDDI